MKIAAVFFTLLLMACCYFPWVTIESKNIVVSGFASEGTNFAHPGILHFILCTAFILFILINKIWSIRVAFFISAFNIAWAIRNFIVIPICQAGICPTKQPALYGLLLSSILMSVCSFLIPAKVKA